MNSHQAQKIAITDYLASEGISPTHTSEGGRFYWYISPIRQGDGTPSFKVDTQNNTWFDYGAPERFDHQKFRRLPDLVIAHKNVTFAEVLRILEYKNLGNASLFAKPSVAATQNTFTNNKASKHPTVLEKKEEGRAFEIVQTKTLQNPHMVAYLEGRGINAAIAAQYVKEVYFKSAKKQIHLFALGFPSGNGFDCRIEKGDFAFKGFVGANKDIACLNMKAAEQGSIAIFEGWIDFLSFLTHKNLDSFNHAAIILFSANQRKKALTKIQQASPQKIFLFLDNDKVGKDCAAFFKDTLGQDMQVIDRSKLYEGFDDYNDFIMGKS